MHRAAGNTDGGGGRRRARVRVVQHLHRNLGRNLTGERDVGRRHRSPGLAAGEGRALLDGFSLGIGRWGQRHAACGEYGANQPQPPGAGVEQHMIDVRARGTAGCTDFDRHIRTIERADAGRSGVDDHGQGVHRGRRGDGVGSCAIAASDAGAQQAGR